MWGIHYSSPFEDGLSYNQYDKCIVKMRDPEDRAATANLISDLKAALPPGGHYHMQYQN